MKLNQEFYLQDTLQVAQKLLGQMIVFYPSNEPLKKSSRRKNDCFRGRILETEAYLGEKDLACHASKGKTARTSVMYEQGGCAYVYLVYGIHFLFNVVTGPFGEPEAVLIRAVELLDEEDPQKKHTKENTKKNMIEAREKEDRKGNITKKNLSCNGPGKWTKTFGISLSENRESLLSSRIFIERAVPFPSQRILASKRIGVDYAGEWKHKFFRFFIQNHSGVSTNRKSIRKRNNTSK